MALISTLEQRLPIIKAIVLICMLGTGWLFWTWVNPWSDQLKSDKAEAETRAQSLAVVTDYKDGPTALADIKKKLKSVNIDQNAPGIDQSLVTYISNAVARAGVALTNISKVRLAIANSDKFYSLNIAGKGTDEQIAMLVGFLENQLWETTYEVTPSTQLSTTVNTGLYDFKVITNINLAN